MATDEEIRKQAVRQSALQTMGLAVLLERTGGRLEFSESEYKALQDRYGGSKNMTVHIEIQRPASGGEASVVLTLVRKPPANGDLVS